ncbi:MAG: RNA polymerase sigma-70 factor [Dysgonomonas sp.]
MDNNINIATIESLRQGDHKAFEAVFIAYYNKIRFFINAYVKSESEAEELAEDLFVNLWENHTKIDTTKSFNSYLHTMARNAAINFLKHKFVHSNYINTAKINLLSATSEEELIAKELGLLIDSVVENMPEQRQQIYILSKTKGFSNEEIAQQLNTTKRNVESQLSLALKEIRKVVSVFLPFLM